jgi:hypothetical protein
MYSMAAVQFVEVHHWGACRVVECAHRNSVADTAVRISFLWQILLPCVGNVVRVQQTSRTL